MNINFEIHYQTYFQTHTFKCIIKAQPYVYETSMPQNFYLFLQNNKMNVENEMKRKTRQPGFHDETS